MARRDIDFSFKAHPLTGDLATKAGSNAIRQSLINIVRSNYYSRGFNTEFAGNIDGSMFEVMTSLTAQSIRDNIDNAIRNFEPQVELIDIEVHDRGANDVDVKIYYTELNDPTERSVSIELSRIR